MKFQTIGQWFRSVYPFERGDVQLLVVDGKVVRVYDPNDYRDPGEEVDPFVEEVFEEILLPDDFSLVDIPCLQEGDDFGCNMFVGGWYLVPSDQLDWFRALITAYSAQEQFVKLETARLKQTLDALKQPMLDRCEPRSYYDMDC